MHTKKDLNQDKANIKMPKITNKKYKPKLAWETAKTYFELRTCPECGGLLIKPGMNDPFTGRWRGGAGYTCNNCGLVQGKIMHPSRLRDPSFHYRNINEDSQRKKLRETLLIRKRVYTEVYNKNKKTVSVYPDAHALLKAFCEENLVEMQDFLTELILEILRKGNE